MLCIAPLAPQYDGSGSDATVAPQNKNAPGFPGAFFVSSLAARINPF